MPTLNQSQIFQFGTKAETLKVLQDAVSSCRIPKFCYFTVERWNNERTRVIEEIRSEFSNALVIVRSSAWGEDGEQQSMAGFFESVPNVVVNDAMLLEDAVERVISSYRKKSGNALHRHQIIVQRMVNDISMSGVVFTQDINTGAPYYVINYDDETGSTNTVTSGSSANHRTLFVHRGSAHELRSERFQALLGVVQEIESITSHDALDIEFAVDKNNKIDILQVRKIATRPNWNRGITLQVNDAMDRMKAFVRERQRSHPGLYGHRTLLGTMPDWNPAEMIGTSPLPLALSLYRHLITDYAWRQARVLMGYNEPPGGRLMVDLFGRPYIDVRLSLNSFLPKGLSPVILEKLVNAWIERLSTHKELHDKLEFEVAITTLSFDFRHLVDRLIPGVLTQEEQRQYYQSLWHLTNNLLTERLASIDGELKKVEELKQRHAQLLSANDTDIQTVSALLEDCIYRGTIPFSILARHAFIATSFIRSLVFFDIWSSEEEQYFRRSIQTVTSDFVTDSNRLSRGEISIGEFMAVYGHLRPGTYDILSKRYDQRTDLFAEGMRSMKGRPEHQDGFTLSSSQAIRIGQLLREYQFDLTADQFMNYLASAIAAREYSKFVFTKNVSDALEMIARWGERNGLSREELAYCSIYDILDVANHAEGRTVESHLRAHSRNGREKYELTKAIRLPYLIDIVQDVSAIPLLVNKPNFITHKTIRAQPIVIDGKNEQGLDIEGAIVFIEGADPGFDWIFSRSIAGLITKYGGVNSHMAIRCAEFGLPAAIGCGEQAFDRLMDAREIELNCSEERIEPIH